MATSVETLSQGTSRVASFAAFRERPSPAAPAASPSRSPAVPVTPSSRHRLTLASPALPRDVPPGVQRVLAPAVRECDKNVASCAGAQTDLTAHIDRLSHELEILVASMPEVSSAAKHAARVTAIKGRVESVAARIASAKERVRALHEEAFEMRRANLVKVAAEPMDELPENRQDMYRGVPEPSQSDDDDDDDDSDDDVSDAAKKSSDSEVEPADLFFDDDDGDEAPESKPGPAMESKPADSVAPKAPRRGGALYSDSDEE